MAQFIDVDGELKHVAEMTLMYSQGNFLPLSQPNQYKFVKTLWGENTAVRTFNQDEQFVLLYTTFKKLFPNKNVLKVFRMLCILMLCYQAIVETLPTGDFEVGPIYKWLFEEVKDGFKPTHEIVEAIVQKHLEDQELRHELKVIETIQEIFDYVRKNRKREAFWKTALDICSQYNNDDRVEGMLDTFSEALQEWYENKLKEGEGDIAGDAKWMKKLYNDVKMIYEATSEKKKKKTRRGKKKKVPPSEEDEEIVWDGGDMWENIVLVKGVF
jgi:hypothetical protein